MGEDSTSKLESDETWEFTLDYITFDDDRIDRLADHELYFVIEDASFCGTLELLGTLLSLPSPGVVVSVVDGVRLH